MVSLPQQALDAPGAWHAGDLLIMRKGAALPDRCVRCNAPTQQHLPMKYSWHHPGYYALILLGLLPYVVVAMAVSDRAAVAVPLCERHLRTFSRLRLASLGLLLLGVLLTFGGMKYDLGAAVILPGLAVMFLAVVPVLTARNFLVPRKIDHSYIWLKRASAPFLESLPAGPSLL
jgi:hypothetical protein